MAVAGRSTELLLTPTRLRVWGWLSALSLVDQGLMSGSGFVLNLLLARWLPAETYGAFAVAFAVFLFASGFHNVLLLEPMTVFGPASYPDRLRDYLRSQLKVHAVLVGTLSGLILLSAAALVAYGFRTPLTSALIGSGIALPFLLLFWLVRRMCYVVQCPSSAVRGSVFYFVGMLAGLVALRKRGVLNPLTAFLLVAAASALASALLLYQHGIFGHGSEPQGSPRWREVFRENWCYVRWLVASTALYAACSQTQTFLTAGLLGLGLAGVLRAMQMPSLVMTQMVVASGLLVMPSMSRDFGLGRMAHVRSKATLTSAALAVVALAYAAILFAAASPIERLFYGGKYASFAWLIPLMGLVPVCTGFSTGYSMALRASQKPQFDLLANSVSAPVAIVFAGLFIRWWGIGGAAVSTVLGFAAYAAVYFLSYRRHAQSPAREIMNV
jgi:O-antigen/teichoic acid export membrane protein